MHAANVKRWKIVAFISFIVAVGSVLLRAAPNTAPSPNAAIEKLQQDRIDTLQAAVDDTASAFNKGASSTTYGELCTRKRLLYEAQLQLTRSHPKRMELLQSMLSNAKDFERYEQLLMQQGKTPLGDAADAKVARLDVEIAIANEEKP
jgi:hypothetical protein